MSTVLLTHVECLCGITAAIPEAGYFPLCGRCGRRMVAPHDKTRVSYVSEPLDLDTAVRQHTENWRGVYHTTFPGQKRQYSDEALTEALEYHHWPTEPQQWATVPDPSTDTGEPGIPVPPWELAG